MKMWRCDRCIKDWTGWDVPPQSEWSQAGPLCPDCGHVLQRNRPEGSRPRRRTGKGAKARLRAVIERDGKHCRWCRATNDLTIDHIVPLSRGGANAIYNLQLLCYECNQIKRDGYYEDLVVEAEEYRMELA